MHFSIITDSYGGPRIHSDEGAVAYEQTYPAIVAKELEALGHKVSVDSASFRKLTDLPGIIQSKEPADVYILQAGIVDLYPRPLSQRWTLSQSFFAKLLRRIIRLNRAFFIRYIYNKPWSTTEEIKNSLAAILAKHTNTIFINAAPVNAFQNDQTPEANRSIDRFNELLKIELQRYPDAIELDIHGMLLHTGDYEKFLYRKDSHLNVLGNQFYAATILEVIKKKGSFGV